MEHTSPQFRGSAGGVARISALFVASVLGLVALSGCSDGAISTSTTTADSGRDDAVSTNDDGARSDDAASVATDSISAPDSELAEVGSGETASDATSISPTTDAAVTDASPVETGGVVTCTGTAPGAYCGGDSVTGGDVNTLYECPGAGRSPTKATPCSAGCVVERAGVPDVCKTPVTSGSYKLPWRSGVTMRLTQDCNDSCCSDHVGTDEYAWDFANGGAFTVVAARGGTVTHLKANSTIGCGSSGCAGDANFIVIDHGDGTQSTYLHLAGLTLGAGVSCGSTVKQGQALATSGTTGWSTGVHLHFQVSKTHPSVATCECGSEGTTCPATSVPWASFWVSATYPSVAISFDEWADSASCGNRRMTMPASTNG